MVQVASDLSYKEYSIKTNKNYGHIKYGQSRRKTRKFNGYDHFCQLTYEMRIKYFLCKSAKLMNQLFKFPTWFCLF